MEQQVTTSGSTTTTLYIGALAEYTLTGGTSWQKYYTFAGKLVADYNGHWHDLLHDQLGTAQVQLNSTGAAESGDLRNPYGNTRYGPSAFMGDLGYTGQRKDSTPNLTYFGARYYDQDVGVFISADTYDAGGLNRYTYVAGNPETTTDPTGHQRIESDGGGGSVLLTEHQKRHKMIRDWPDYGEEILQNYTKYNKLPPLIADQRDLFHRLSPALDDQLEYTDAQALAKYYGLSVNIQDPKRPF